MGKKGKGTKKEDKPKKDATSSRDKLKEALEADESRPKATPPRITSRNTASKKNERSGPIKLGWTESFRWDNSEQAPVLPPMPQTIDQGTLRLLVGRSKRDAMLVYSLFLQKSDGLKKYLEWRCRGDAALLEASRNSKTLKDGLSAPLTIASKVAQRVWLRASARPPGDPGNTGLTALESGEPLHIVVIGATAVNEEKILRESDYWDELFNLLAGRKVHLYLTGPEMSGKDGVFKSTTKNNTGRSEGEREDGPKAQMVANRNVECWKTNGIDFFLQKGRLDLFQKEETVVVGLNCGFGMAADHILRNPLSPDDPPNEVLWKWIPTLHFLAALDLPIIISCSSLADTRGCLFVLQLVIGVYRVVSATESSAPFESSITAVGQAMDKTVKANSRCVIVQGQQPGFSFAAEDHPDPGGIETDDRLNRLRKLGMSANQPWPDHESVRKAGRQSYGIRERVSPLVPLKRYGNYPLDEKETETVSSATCESPRASKAMTLPTAASNGDAAEAAEGDSDAPAVAEGRSREGAEGEACPTPSPPESVKLEYSVSDTVDGGSDALEITVKRVLMTDPSAARLGVKRNSVALYYYDCQSFRDVVFEADLPKAVDHTTTKAVFRRSKHSVTIVVRLLESKK